MPELPEVETVRRSLEPYLLGRSIRNVDVRRADVITGPRDDRALLRGCEITQIRRHGKQLAILARPQARGSAQREAPVICVHLGMTGSLQFRLPESKRHNAMDSPIAHLHIRWELADGGSLLFADPRRFGGLWTFPSEAVLIDQRWRLLGEDALTIQPRQLHARLQKTCRAIKAALLDQHIIAGLGNIYVDELLFACRLHPNHTANSLSLAQVQQLVPNMRRILRRSIDRGGSSLRDYVNANGEPGWFKIKLKVYGRAGEPCKTCGGELASIQVAGRTTVYCPCCQIL